MALELFLHNQRAFSAVEAMLDAAGKAAVEHPADTVSKAVFGLIRFFHWKMLSFLPAPG